MDGRILFKGILGILMKCNLFNQGGSVTIYRLEKTSMRYWYFHFEGAFRKGVSKHAKYRTKAQNKL